MQWRAHEWTTMAWNFGALGAILTGVTEVVANVKAEGVLGLEIFL